MTACTGNGLSVLTNLQYALKMLLQMVVAYATTICSIDPKHACAFDDEDLIPMAQVAG